MITKSQLIEQIREMGICPDDKVLIHTSMRAIGTVDGGADTVIDAFCEVLTEGMLLVPTHTWNVVTPKNPIYDVRKTVPNIGALPRVAAFREDGFRSLHPTHSLWAKGVGAEAFVAGEERAESPGAPGFAWARIADIGAKILLIGVLNNRNTFIHAVDEIYGLPDRISKTPYTVTIRDVQGKEYTHPYYGHHCSRTNDVSQYYVNFEPAFLACGVQTFGRLGGAEVRIIDAAKCRDAVMHIFRQAELDPTREDKDLCIRFEDIPESYYR